MSVRLLTLQQVHRAEIADSRPPFEFVM